MATDIEQELSPRPAGKIVPLEALRGIAALMVFFLHGTLSFLPWIEGGGDGGLFYDTPLYFIINGRFSVIFFFVLSGFVLSYRAFLRDDKNGLPVAALKRWPRLCGPVLLITLLSCLCYVTGLYADKDVAATLAGSSWLKTYDGMIVGEMTPSFRDALGQGLYGVFAKKPSTYNPSLWTMTFELGGSFIVFGLAWLLLALRQRKLLLGLALVVMLILARRMSPFYICFPVGMVLAWLYAHRPWRVDPMGTVMLGTIAVYLGGYTTATNWYGWVDRLPFVSIAAREVILYVPASVCVIVMVLGQTRLYRSLDSRLGRWLGDLSFPLYLVHVPVICAVGAPLYLALHDRVGPVLAAMICIAVCLMGTLLLALPFARFDAWWTRAVNNVAQRLMGKFSRRS